MNKEMLTKLRGALLQLRPKAREFRANGELIGECDDWWSVSRATEDGIELVSLPLVFWLPRDHIHKVQSAPGWTPERWTVLTTSEIQIRGDRVHLEPLHPHPKVSTPGPGPSPEYQITQDLRERMADSRRTEKEGDVNQDNPFGGDEFVGWRCSRGTRNESEQQRCSCGCGTLMVEGTMIFRDEQTGEEYEGAPRGMRRRADC